MAFGKAKRYETSMYNGKRVFVVQIPHINVCFSLKSESKRFKQLYDKATKHTIK